MSPLLKCLLNLWITIGVTKDLNTLRFSFFYLSFEVEDDEEEEDVELLLLETDPF